MCHRRLLFFDRCDVLEVCSIGNFIQLKVSNVCSPFEATSNLRTVGEQERKKKKKKEKGRKKAGCSLFPLKMIKTVSKCCDNAGGFSSAPELHERTPHNSSQISRKHANLTRKYYAPQTPGMPPKKKLPSNSTYDTCNC